jgi:hypothetical protein
MSLGITREVEFEDCKMRNIWDSGWNCELQKGARRKAKIWRVQIGGTFLGQNSINV